MYQGDKGPTSRREENAVWKRWLLKVHVGSLACIIPDISKRLGIKRLLAMFTPKRPSRVYEGMSADEIVAVIERRLARPWRMRGRKCLRKGLLTFYFLRLAGYEPELHFAVFARKQKHEKAHCWVMLDDKLLGEPPHEPHVVMLIYRGDEEPPKAARQAA
jgi:hypothetical protein